MSDFHDLDDQLISLRSLELIDLLKFRLKSGKPLKDELLQKVIEVGNLSIIIQQEQDKGLEK
tara:strand:+ start:6456 stop:6641 length:186 start_codon:yes stop_codon:yes gene_type:complete